MGELLARDEVRDRLTRHRRRGARIAFTSGTFDLLHRGHLRSLQHARSTADLLVVGVHSDRSVRKDKGPLRPIQDERTRAELVASLIPVDYVFIFDEPTTDRSIELLRPDVYVKGSDRRVDQLSSSPIVRQYGGRVVLAPYLEGVCTSALIDRVLARFMGSPQEPGVPVQPRPAVFLERDGVLIEHVDYLDDPRRVRPIPGSFAAVAQLRAHGLCVVMVTNQPGIGIGDFTKGAFFKVNKRILELASQEGALFDRVLFCPHSLAERCRCRKPGTEMVERAIRELHLERARCVVVGDMTTDVQLGRDSGWYSVLVQTGHAGSDGRCQVVPDVLAPNLAHAVPDILRLLEEGGASAEPDNRALSEARNSEEGAAEQGRYLNEQLIARGFA